LNWD